MSDKTAAASGQRDGAMRGDAKFRLRQLADQLTGHAAAVDSGRPVAITDARHDGGDWDIESAEALTRAYEQSVGGSPAFTAAPVTAVRSPSGVTPGNTVGVQAVRALPVVAAAPEPPLSQLAGDQHWLAERLDDLVAKVDEAVRRLDPAEQIAPLAQRLDGIDGHLRALVDDSVGRHAFTGLETQVSEVRSHLEHARTRLAHLDGIEARLDMLTAIAEAASAAPASDGPIAAPPVDIEAVVSRAVERSARRVAQQAPAAVDIDAIVERAVSRSAERFAAAHPAGPGPAALADLQSLVSGHVAEYRREQSQTSAALMTMQEALIRLIDRIDQYDAEMSDEAAAADPVPAPASQPVERPAPAAMRQRPAPESAVRHSARPEHPHAAAQPTDAAAPVVAPAPTIHLPPSAPAPATAQRAARRIPTAATDPATAVAAEAMAAERARVAAERAVGATVQRRPAPRAPEADAAPTHQIANTEAPVVPAGNPRAARTGASAGGNVARRGMIVAGIAVALIGSSTIAHLYLSGHFSSAKTADRIPASTGPRTTSKQIVAPAAPGAIPDVRPQPAAQRLPQPQPATRQVTPGETPQEAPRRRPIPETVTDDLSANTAGSGERPSVASSAAMRPTQAAIQGIALDGASLPDPAELARRLQPPQGASQAAPQAVAPQTPPAQTISAISQPEPIVEPAARGGAVELPPAAIGPSSLRMSAQQGDPGAQFEVAARFAEGKGIKQDFAQAIAWYTRAAQKGFIPAQYRLATLYERGLGTTADLTRAKVWYRRAADQGNTKAMHNLAVLAAGPQQAEPDYPTAVRWFTEAAERGLADSQFNLAVLSENGLGMQKDLGQAYKWFALAARSGDKEALRRRDQMLATFTPDQARQAEQLVATWRSKPTDMKANDVRSAAQAWAAEQDAQRAAMMQKMAEQQQRQAAAQPAPAQPAPAPTLSHAKPTAKVAKTVAKP